MAGGASTGFSLVTVGVGLVAGGSVCLVACHGIRRRINISAQRHTFPACTELVCGTLCLMIGAMALGFGRLCLRDVHLGACTNFGAAAIVAAGAGVCWSGALLTLTFGYLVNETAGAPRAWQDQQTWTQ